MKKLFVGGTPKRLYWRTEEGTTTSAFSRPLPTEVLDYLQEHLPPLSSNRQSRRKAVTSQGSRWQILHPPGDNWPTFTDLATLISRTLDKPIEKIIPKSHISNDLGIDSFDFLDLAFAIDEYFGITISPEGWYQSANYGGASSDNDFTVGALCHEIDLLVAEKNH